jgi:hypothetical protein
MTELIHVKNFGFLQTKLPTDLFIKLKEECQNTKELKEMKSGLSGKGVPKHFYIEKCFSELKDYILHCVYEYDKNFQYIESLKFLNKNAPFLVTPPWLNVQKRYEFLPLHDHEGVLSYNIWIQIPYDIKKELHEQAAQLQFIYPMTCSAKLGIHKFILSKADEGNLIMFPSTFMHVLCPFYTSKNVRLSVAGNILLEAK